MSKKDQQKYYDMAAAEREEHQQSTIIRRKPQITFTILAIKNIPIGQHVKTTLFTRRTRRRSERSP